MSLRNRMSKWLYAYWPSDWSAWRSSISGWLFRLETWIEDWKGLLVFLFFLFSLSCACLFAAYIFLDLRGG